MADPAAEKDLPKRKHPRLKNYDYAAPGAYFVTICVQGRKCILSEVVGRGDLTPPDLTLTAAGRVIERYIGGIETAYPGVTVDRYVVMPNHVHILLTIHPPKDGGVGSPRPTLITIVRAFKSLTTRHLGKNIWQTSFYEHIVRDDIAYQEIWNYIDANPLRWTEDKFYIPTEAPP